MVTIRFGHGLDLKMLSAWGLLPQVQVFTGVVSWSDYRWCFQCHQNFKVGDRVCVVESSSCNRRFFHENCMPVRFAHRRAAKVTVPAG